MTALKKKRKGFSLVEMVAVAIILAIITIACVAVMQSTATMRIASRNSIYMTTHNLNVMEKIRQEINRLGIYGELHAYYGFADNDEEWEIIPLDKKNILKAVFGTESNAIDILASPELVTLEQREALKAQGIEFDDVVFRADYSTDDIRTEVFIEINPWDNFHVYSIRIESKLIGYSQRVTNTLVLTDIGIQKNPIIPEEYA